MAKGRTFKDLIKEVVDKGYIEDVEEMDSGKIVVVKTKGKSRTFSDHIAETIEKIEKQGGISDSKIRHGDDTIVVKSKTKKPIIINEHKAPRIIREIKHNKPKIIGSKKAPRIIEKKKKKGFLRRIFG